MLAVMSMPQPRFADARHRQFALGLLGVYLLIWTSLAIKPLYRADWLLENVLVAIAVPMLVATYHRLPLSRISYAMLFIFFCIHAVGSHYTYAEVPYDDWTRRLFGTSLGEAAGWDRNHYDRFVHLMYGLLIVYPVRELFLRVADARGFWGYFFPLLVVMSSSLAYELLEWGAAFVFGGELGMAYLGTQGDVWDAHKDSLLATGGALAATLVIAAVHSSFDRDFGRDWAQSLTVKNPDPLGEAAIGRYLNERENAP